MTNPAVKDRPKADGSAFVPSIQGLRGVAALSVLIAHFHDMPKGGVYDAPNPGFLPPIWLWLEAVFDTSGHGVELFFMISGFLIPASLVRHGSVAKFMFDRVMRIMPVFVVLHLVVFAIGPIVGYKFFRGLDVGGYLETFFANLLFVQDALGLPIAQQNAWTLTYEWAFYIWFAVAFTAAKQWNSMGLTVLLVAVGLVCVVHWPIAAFFIIGMAFSVTDLRFRLNGPVGMMAGLACAAVMYASLDMVHPFFGLLPGFLLFGMVLSGSGIGAVLCAPALQYLGKVSYSLYLVHPFVLYPLQVAGLKLVTHGANRWLLWAGFVIFGLALTLVASALSYELIEIRLRRRIDNMLRNIVLRPVVRSRPV